jgi:hypothetical protein
MSRLDDLVRFYALLDRLSAQSAGPRTLAELSDFRDCPEKGVYFFLEDGEDRRESGSGPRVVRVGTHAVSAGSRTILRHRLSQHRGNKAGAGDHRSSVFRLLMGQALMARGDVPHSNSWAIRTSKRNAITELGITREILERSEYPVERAVSTCICRMPVLWLSVIDESGVSSLRTFIERNSIALLSNAVSDRIDPPSATWLGLHSGRRDVVDSGLWNQRHVRDAYDPRFLDTLERLISGSQTEEVQSMPRKNRPRIVKAKSSSQDGMMLIDGAFEYEYRWPSGNEEHYDQCFVYQVESSGEVLSVRIGFGMRDTYGRKRRRVVVWINGYPQAEFLGADDYSDTRDTLCEIKIQTADGYRLCKYPSQRVPERYSDLLIVGLPTRVKAKGTHKAWAVLANESDHVAYIRTGLLRMEDRKS